MAPELKANRYLQYNFTNRYHFSVQLAQRSYKENITERHKKLKHKISNIIVCILNKHVHLSARGKTAKLLIYTRTTPYNFNTHESIYNN